MRRRDTASPGDSSGAGDPQPTAGPHSVVRLRTFGPGLSSTLLADVGLPTAAGLRIARFLLARSEGLGVPSRQPHAGAGSGGGGLGESAGGRGGRSSSQARLLPVPERQERR